MGVISLQQGQGLLGTIIACSKRVFVEASSLTPLQALCWITHVYLSAPPLDSIEIPL